MNIESTLKRDLLNFSSKDVAKFTPQGQDPVNGNLGSGEVGIDQIQNLMNIK